MTKSPSTAMINQVRHDIHPSASVVGGLINLLQDLANEVQAFLSMMFATSARIRFGRLMKSGTNPFDTQTLMNLRREGGASENE